MTLRRAMIALASAASFALAPPAFGQVNPQDLARGLQRLQEDLKSGTHRFRYLFESAGCKPVSDWSELVDHPRDSVLVVLGQTAVLGDIPRGLVSFLENGGSALVASDRQSTGGPLVRYGVAIHGATLEVDPRDAYHEITDCPFVDPIVWADSPFSDSELRRLRRVATNRPGYLELTGDALTRYAVFLRSANFKGKSAPGGLFYFAAGRKFPGGGRLLVLSDHSVFINGMLWQSDNDNLRFANNCVEWLTETGTRRRIFFWDEGAAQSQLELPATPPRPQVPLPPPDVVVQIVDEGLEGLEHENRFNKLIAAKMDEWSDVQSNPFVVLLHRSLGIRTDESASTNFALVFLGGSVAAGLFGCHWLSRAKQRREPGLKSLDAALHDLPVGESLLQQRGKALARGVKSTVVPVGPDPRNSASGDT